MKRNVWLFGLAGFGLIALFLIFKSSPEKVLETSKDIANSPAVIEESSGDSRAFDRMQKRISVGIDEQRMINELEAEHQKELAEEARKKAEEEAKRKAEEDAYWESRQDWIANFPFQPTYHPTITFDPEVMNLDVDERGFPIETEEYEMMNRVLERHRFLSFFYNDCEKQRYSPEFEKMHHILSEYLDEDPYTWGRAFTHLVKYHHANIHDPDEQYLDGQYFADTWGDRTASILESFGGLFIERIGLDDEWETLLPEEEADAVRDRLIAEIPAEGFFNHSIIAGHYKYQDALEEGDALLIR